MMGKKKLTVKIDEDLLNAIKQQAKDRSLTLDAHVSNTLRDAVLSSIHITPARKIKH